MAAVVQIETLKIGIVEDDMIIARALSEMLVDSGYAVTTPATRYSEAIAMIEDERPDILLLDIKLPGKMDGIMIAKTVKEQFKIPFIFLTGNTDTATINRAKPMNPAAFLAKPVSRDQLFAAIEIAVATFLTANATVTGQAVAATPDRDYIFVRDNNCYRRIKIEEIICIESEENYVRLQLVSGNKVLVRYTLKDFTAQLDSRKFIRVHRSYTIALNKIKEAQSEQLIMEKEIIIPLSRVYKDELMHLLLS